MRTMTLEKFMRCIEDAELLDVYQELESGKVPSTSYAHDFCRRVNKMVDDGELTVRENGFRHIYLPSLRKLVYKEMASRYALYLRYCKAPQPAINKPIHCDNCGELFDSMKLRGTEYGLLCDRCYEQLVDKDEEDEHKCVWCKEEFDSCELIQTDMGPLCERCLTAIRSRGERVNTW